MLVTVAINQLLILQDIYPKNYVILKYLISIMIIRYSYYISFFPSNAATEMF